MEKLSAQQVQYLLAHSADMLEKQAHEIRELRARNEAYQRREEASKIASDLQDKNLSPAWGSSEEEVVQHIMNLPQDKLAAVRMAVEFAAPHDPFAYLDNSRESFEGDGRVKGASAFEQFIFGNM